LLLTGISLRNIRSYGNEETSIDLRPGLTLFEGDIGSGKSTILAAVEFGLFGLGDFEAKHLLRHGAKKGSVKVAFEAGGRHYAVSRTLAKSGRGIQQEDCRLEGDGVVTSYSPSELKPRMLEILGFNEKPDTKSTSRIFRYAIYTPQESMKEVLSMGDAQRLDTLRRAFGIELYSWVVANAEDAVIREWLNRRLDVLEGEVADLPKKKAELGALGGALVDLHGSVEKLTKEEAEASSLYSRVQEQIRELEPRKLAVAVLRREIPAIELDLKESRQRAARIAEDQRATEAELTEASEAGDALEALRPNYDEYAAKKARLLELESSSEEYSELTGAARDAKGRIEVERRVLEKEAADLEGDVKRVKDVSERIETAEVHLKALLGRRDEMAEEVTALEKEEAELKESEKEMTRLEAERATGERELSKVGEEWTKMRDIGAGGPCPLCRQTLTPEHYRDVLEEYSLRLKSLEEAQEGIARRMEMAASAVDNGKKCHESLLSLRSEARELEGRIGRAENKLEELKEERAKLEGAAAELTAKRELLAKEAYAAVEREALKRAEAHLATLHPLMEELDEYKKRIAELEDKRVAAEFIRLRLVATKRVVLEGRLARFREDEGEALKHIADKERDLKEKSAQLSVEEPFLAKLEEAEASRKSAESQLADVREELAGTRSKLEEVRGRARSLEEEVGGMETKRAEMVRLEQTKRWLKELFIPCVSAIEREVLASINEQFDEHFQQWFSTLMEGGDISVRIDESFSPVVEQDGYEIDVGSLSGGERTSLALAYRLALNTMVKQQSSSKSGLLILDEPTDGFSSGQLLKLRDVLQETGCEQIIMVSHEKELESFVDNIYQVSRLGGESAVTKISR
jgi:exonuclease SbcC